MKKTFYITTPIFYPSGNLHIGHVYTTTLARTIANYKIMMGYDVKLLTGADEHGQKIQEKAKALKVSEEKYVDEMSSKFTDLWKQLGIDYDYFSRTTNKNHGEAVAKQFSTLLKDGIIYKGEYKGLYSVQDEEFLTKTQAVEKGGKFYHPESNHLLEEVTEETYFFKMSKFEKWLKDYLKSNKDFIIPEKIVNELTNNFLDKGLEDLSVTRSSFTWGVKIKEDPKHVMYVWLDALNNYITALGYNSSNDLDFQKYWVNGDEIIHLVGKEITRFHGIYWPIILKASNLRLPTTILSHGWIITPEGKMSKSKGNVVDPIDLLKRYDPEVIKYFFATQMNITQDGVFEEERLINVYNANLANNYGNLLSRTIAMYHQNFEVPVTYKEKELVKEDKEIFKQIENTIKSFKEYFDKFKLHKAFGHVTELSKSLNGYIDITKPWLLKEDLKRLEVVLNTLFNGIYAVTTMLSPVMPNKTKDALGQLKIKELVFKDITNYNKFDKINIGKSKIIFERKK